MLRRETEPSEELVEALLPTGAAKMNCPNCGNVGLDAQQEEIHRLWREAVLCRICRQPISDERLEAVPNAGCCARCQADAEAGSDADEPEYCPVCGSLMVLRASSNGGITRYRLYCTATPACRL